MKSFDPMNPGDDREFEQQLLGMELRRPPAEWKALLIPKPVPPLFPRPLLLGLAVCWTVVAGFILATPEDPMKGLPLLVPESPEPMPLLGYQEPAQR
jgi:hypothetical protein